MQALATRAAPTICEFATQNLSNFVWAFATLKVVGQDAGASVDQEHFTAEEIANMPNFSAQEL